LRFADYAEALRVNEAIDQQAALDRAIFVENKHRHVLYVVVERVAERDHFNQRREKEEKESQRIAPDDDELLKENRAEPAKKFVLHVLYKERRAPRVWEAQAASLSFSAACRKAHRTFIARDLSIALEVVGKLPTTTGWQPVLPEELHARSFMINSRGAMTHLMRLFAVPQRALLKAQQKRLRAKDLFRESRDD